MRIFFSSVKLFILVTALLGVCTDFAWAVEMEIQYRYGNRNYKGTNTKVCGNKEDAIRLVNEMKSQIRNGISSEEFKDRYEDPGKLNDIYPKCNVYLETKSTPIEIIPTTGMSLGISYEIFHDPEREGIGYKLYSVYIKKKYDFRYYDSQDQLIGLIESGEIDWDWLSDREKQAIWKSFDNDPEGEKFKKRLEALYPRGAASLPNLLNESFATLKCDVASGILRILLLGAMLCLGRGRH